ncbi:MAG: M1 family aminopeptidase [Pseudomonadota bacterium]
MMWLRRIIALQVLAILICLVFPSGVALSQTGPTHNIPVTQRLDVEHVSLDLRFRSDAKEAVGTATIRLSTEKPASTVTLNSVGLDIESVEIIGRGPAEFSIVDSYQDGGLEIDLGSTYLPGEIAEIQISYRTTRVNDTDPSNIWGSYGKGLRFLGPSSSDHRRRIQIWSSGMPGSNRRWFPSYDQPDDLRTFEIIATVDAGLTAISNGRLVDEVINNDGTKSFHWREAVEHQNHRSSIVIGSFEKMQESSESIVLYNFGYPDEMVGVKASIDRLSDMANFMEETIGTSYPFASYSQVFVQELPWGLSNSGLAILTENFVDSAEVHRDFLYLWDDLEAQSLAEQWFGNAIGTKGWEHTWVAKGLPRYLATLYNEARNGEAEILLSSYHVPGDLATIHSDQQNGRSSKIVPAKVTDPSSFFVGNASAIRATVALRTLEGEIGRDALLRAIKRFANEYHGKLVSTSDFERAVAREAGQELGWFFDQWFRRLEFPVLEVAHTYDQSRGVARVQIKQHVDSTAKAFFRGAMTLELGERVERVTLAPQHNNEFEIAVDRKPEFLNADFKSMWLAKKEHRMSTTEMISLAKKSKDILARSVALRELAKIASNAETASNERQNILQLFSSILESDEYWRLKMVAMFQLRQVLSENGNAPNAGLNGQVSEALVRIINGKNRDEAWIRFAALGWLGELRNNTHADLYINLLRDPSDRVINAAAIALGKSKDARAFGELVRLEAHPSWKNQSRISMLNGLAELGDIRGVSIAERALMSLGDARWTLITPVWDYRLAAAHTLRRLESQERGFDFVYRMFNQAVSENHVNDMVYNLHLMVALADPRALEAVELARSRFAENDDVLKAIDSIDSQLDAAL